MFSAVESVVLITAMVGAAAAGFLAAIETKYIWNRARTGDETWAERASIAREMRSQLSR